MSRKRKYTVLAVWVFFLIITSVFLTQFSHAATNPNIEEQYKAAVVECLKNNEAVCKKAELIVDKEGISESEREEWDKQIVPEIKYKMAFEKCRQIKNERCEEAERIAYWHDIPKETETQWKKDMGSGTGADDVSARQHIEQGFVSIKISKAHKQNSAQFNEAMENAIQEFSAVVESDASADLKAKALELRGTAYMIQKKYNKALDDLNQAVELQPESPTIHYNLASLYSIEKKIDLGLDAIDSALANGFNNYDALRKDPDIANLRRNPEFKKILEKHKVFLE